MIIKESFLLAADDTDILAAPSRLNSIPRGGLLTIEASATDCDATNFGLLTLQPPQGDIPFENLHIPANGVTTADAVMDTDTQLLIRMEVAQGGHVLLAYDENGTVALVLIIVTLAFP